MAPKEQKSKKAIREQSAKRMDDATFGLKNKNKSSKVQKFVKQVEVAVKHSDGSTARAQNAELKKAQKLARAAEMEELNALLGVGLVGNVTGKKRTEMDAKAASLGLTSMPEDLAELLAELSSDSSEEEEVREKRQTIYMDSDSDSDREGVTMHREKTIEDLIDEQRAKLAAEGKTGTPVTEASFAVWRKAKLEQRQKEAEARMKMESTKRKGGKGLSALSGRELFKYDSSLFQDDDAAVTHEQEMELSEATRVSQEAEAEAERRETEKAQKEQERLMEAQRQEIEARRLIDIDRRTEAAKRLELFTLGGVVVNKVVFREDDREDLAPFEDDTDSEDEEDYEEEEDGEDGDDAAAESTEA
jgi:hypothetical protein